MANITAGMVKDLREKTGAGMMDCKTALAETSGDLEAAVDWLRKKGISKAAKKAGRVAAEGLIGVAVRALVRNQERAEVARHNGADEAVIGDLTKPASLTDAVAGIDGVFHIGPAHAAGEAQMGVAMIDAAQVAGVRKFVFSGVIHPSISAMTNHAAAKLPVEEALYNSELDFTVLQPARFMQNFERSWDDVIEHDRLAQPYSLSAKMCSVDYRDVAEVAALAMTGSDLSYGTFELCAPGMQNSHETAAILSEVLRRPITAVQTREPRSLKDYFRELASR